MANFRFPNVNNRRLPIWCEKAVALPVARFHYENAKIRAGSPSTSWPGWWAQSIARILSHCIHMKWLRQCSRIVRIVWHFTPRHISVEHREVSAWVIHSTLWELWFTESPTYYYKLDNTMRHTLSCLSNVDQLSKLSCLTLSPLLLPFSVNVCLSVFVVCFREHSCACSCVNVAFVVMSRNMQGALALQML